MAKRGSGLNKKTKKEKDQRPIRWRRYDHLFLIVCEDEKTEPYYFEAFIEEFPAETVFLKTVGTGRSSKGVVEQAAKERDGLLKQAGKNVDEVWAVFDKDDAEKSPGNAKRFEEAFELARKETIEVAYSNEVFELWLLLHFAEVSADTPIPRADIYTNLETAIKKFPKHQNFAYEHGNTQVIDILKTNGNEQQAIARATQLFLEHTSKSKPLIEANPSTKVHLLVQRLRELIAWYAYTP
jgi:hypothetical protein